MSAEFIDVRRLASQRWKNGAGLTRELAVEPIGATAEGFEWRISVAEITRDGPFSAYPQVDRCITLLRGAGMTLRSSDGSVNRRLDRVGEPFSFSGDVPVEAKLIGGASEDLNVMARRGRHRAEVTSLTTRCELAAAPAGLLLCIAGRWRCAGRDEALEAGQALLWRQGMPAITVEPAATHGHAMAVQLHPSRQDDGT